MELGVILELLMTNSVLPAGRVATPAVALELTWAEEVANAPKPVSAEATTREPESVATLIDSAVNFLVVISEAVMREANNDPETVASDAVIRPVTERLPLTVTSPLSAMTSL